VPEAKEAAAAGADAVIMQGVEAGGHVRGTMPLLELLERTRAALKIPLLAAGGIIDAEGVREALDAGASAAVVGTRFLLSEESRAHPGYKQRCLDARETLLTELFGLSWSDAPHRVIPNAATSRWLRSDPRGPAWIRTTNRLTAPLARRIPPALAERALSTQRAGQPFLSPRPPSAADPPSLLDAAPLYAGVGVAAISDVRPARELVAALTP
jgi:NAD(P)H-dependent flavin oxidoreductase YrpB (nitropropane dioxygenase family)